MNNTSIPTAQLWIGQQSVLDEKAEQFIQHHLCSSRGCNVCVDCTHVRTRQHHALMWVQPDIRYTLDIIKPIIHTVSFTLEADQKKFIVIQAADALGSVCGNSLLKTIEEPPHGYHFILLAQRLDDVLPTLRSRCTLNRYSTESISSTFTALIEQFTNLDMRDSMTFYQVLEDAVPSERETKELLDTIFVFWKKKYAQTLSKQSSKQLPLARHMLAVITHAMHQPPMPGSSKLFWRNLFLRSLDEAPST